MTHPVVLAALALLVLNDHVLKAAFPGAVTGKLSDVAGPVVAAALLGGPARALWPRLPHLEAAAWAAVGAAFVLLKTVPSLNALVPLAGVADPWDALGALVLPFAWRLTRRPPPWRPGTLPRAVAIVAAVLAVSATSYVPDADVFRVEQADGGIVHAYAVTPSGAVATYESRDLGLTWARLHGESARAASPAPRPRPPARGRACAGERCYDLSTGEIRESLDGGKTWKVSLERDPEGPSDLEDVVFADERTVLVAAGGEGVFRREGDGPWRVVAVDPDEDRDGSWSLFQIALQVAAFMLLLAAVLVAIGFALDRVVRASRPAHSEGEAVWYRPPRRRRWWPPRSRRHRR